MIYTNIIKIFVTEISVTPGRNNFFEIISLITNQHLWIK